METEEEGMSPLGKVLLLLGGAVVLGTILSIDDEPEKSTRETSQLGKRKEKGSFLSERWSSQVKKEKPSKPNTIKILKIDTSKPNTAKQSKNLGGNHQSSSTTRQYPDHYYSLSKGAQYKFRKKMSKLNLPEFTAYEDNANFE